MSGPTLSNAGWHIRLLPRLSWHRNKSWVLVYDPFTKMQTKFGEQNNVSPCTSWYYLPNARVRCATMRFVETTMNRISKIRHNGIGILLDGYATMNICRQRAGMQRRFVCCWIKRSLRTPLPLALVAIWKGLKVQGDHSGWVKPPVDIKTKVPF